MSSTKIMLVTGGNSGLGENMALQIAAKGMDVIIIFKVNRVDSVYH
jgi:NAD(P)-dependent dehydrogenase (short-subunit alcohol dehydrogenase family)